MNGQLDPLEDLVGDLFVDRHEELDMYWNWATRIPHWPLNSFAMVGRRRTGKTAILVKLFNRLFHEQERVLPVFITFAHYLHRKEPISCYDFARDYFNGYLRCYLAFRYREPLLVRMHGELKDLHEFAQQVQDKFALELIDRYQGARTGPLASAFGLAQWVIRMPSAQAAIHNMPTAVIIDEFQILTRIHDPDQNVYRHLTDSFQQAVETWWAPVLVTGSAVSTLVSEALGSALSGRFRYHYIDPLPQAYAHELVFRLGEFTGMTVNEELAQAIWQLTAGYPYSIQSLMTSPCPARHRYPALEALEEVMAYELSNPEGYLWQHYDEEFQKYSEQLNASQVTKKVLFWATKYPEKAIDAGWVAHEIGAAEEEVQAALRKLYQADLVDRIGWALYQGPGDPMLRRYIEYNYRREVEKLAPAEAIKDWQAEYQSLRGQVSNFVGKVAEVYVQAVMQAFDGREVDGKAYFSHAGSIRLPTFETIERRGGVVKAGVPIEIDLAGEWTLPENKTRAAWLVQVKYTQDPIGKDAVQQFLAQAESVLANEGYASVTRWYVCKSGYTREAKQALEEVGVLYSDLTQFNALANLFDFFGLPK